MLGLFHVLNAFWVEKFKKKKKRETMRQCDVLRPRCQVRIRIWSATYFEFKRSAVVTKVTETLIAKL